MGFRLNLDRSKRIVLRNADEARALAIKLKGYGGTECERDEKASIMAHIKAKMLNAEMTPFYWRIGTVLSSRLVRRVDGQHSEETFLGLTPEEWAVVVFPIVIEWEDYDCDVLLDLANLFEQFNPSWSSRKPVDYMGAHLNIHEELRHTIDRYVCLKATTGLAWYREKVKGEKMTSRAPFELVHENHDISAFLTYCGSFLQKGKTEEMHSRVVLAAIYHTTTGGSDEVRSFWRRVASGKAPHDADTIEYKLAEFLDMARDDKTEWPATVRRHFKTGKVRPSELDILATCLRGFMAWSKGTKIGDIFTASKTRNAIQLFDELKAVTKAA